MICFCKLLLLCLLGFSLIGLHITSGKSAAKLKQRLEKQTQKFTTPQSPKNISEKAKLPVDSTTDNAQEQLPLFTKKFEVPQIKSNDYVLFVGSFNALQGSVFDYGCISIFNREVKKIFSEVEISSIPLRPHDFDAFYNNLLVYLMETRIPDKIVFLLDQDQIHESEFDNAKHVIEVQTEFEMLIARIIKYYSELSKDISIVLVPVIVKNEGLELLDGDLNGFDKWISKLQVLSQFYPEISYLDLSFPILKFLERVNLGGHSHSILTYDGKHLNHNGHLLIAVHLLLSFLKLERNKIHARIIKPLLDELNAVVEKYSRHQVDQLQFQSALKTIRPNLKEMNSKNSEL